MRYYPVFLDLKGKRAVVIGGGGVAERKVKTLIKSGASVTVISPEASTALIKLAERGAITLKRRGYRQGDLRTAFLAVSASDSGAVNEAVYKEASRSNVLVNIADDPERCGFIAPSIVERGPVIIAISTSGTSPLLARTLRKEIERTVPPECGQFADILGAVRNKLLKNGPKNVKKERVFKLLVNSPMPGWIRAGETGEIDRFLKRLLGPGFTLTGLGISLKRRKKAAKAAGKVNW